jgi:hypothetical protein
MAYKDGETFTTYCDNPYDQNDYLVHLKDGREVRFSDYEELRSFWWQYSKRDVLSHVTIVDKPKKSDGKKGF